MTVDSLTPVCPLHPIRQSSCHEMLASLLLALGPFAALAGVVYLLLEVR